MITVRRGDADYEATRRRMVWQKRIPQRFPDVIVSVTSDAEVTEALQTIRQRHDPQGVFYGHIGQA